MLDYKEKYSVFDNILEGVQVISRNWRYLYVNNMAVEYIRKPRKELLGNKIMQVHPGLEDTEIFDKMQDVMLGNKREVTTVMYEFPDGHVGYFDLFMEPTDEGIIVFSFDVTEQKKNELMLSETNKKLQKRTEQLEHQTNKFEELLDLKTKLLQELHHRVKNNFQLIISILKLQIQNIEDPDIQQIFRRYSDRITTLALLHNMSYATETIVSIDPEEFLHNLIDEKIMKSGVENLDYELKVDIVKPMMNIDTAIPLGLLTNEILSNSIKHGRSKSDQVEVYIELVQNDAGLYTLTIGDHGPGIPSDIHPEKQHSIGLKLISILTKQLEGSMGRISNEQGTKYEISFKELKPHKFGNKKKVQ